MCVSTSEAEPPLLHITTLTTAYRCVYCTGVDVQPPTPCPPPSERGVPRLLAAAGVGLLAAVFLTVLIACITCKVRRQQMMIQPQRQLLRSAIPLPPVDDPGQSQTGRINYREPLRLLYTSLANANSRYDTIRYTILTCARKPT